MYLVEENGLQNFCVRWRPRQAPEKGAWSDCLACPLVDRSHYCHQRQHHQHQKHYQHHHLCHHHHHHYIHHQHHHHHQNDPNQHHHHKSRHKKHYLCQAFKGAVFFCIKIVKAVNNPALLLLMMLMTLFHGFYPPLELFICL